MESMINSLVSNKILIIILFLLASLIIYSIIKRLVKLIIIIIIALVLYIGYMDYKGEKIDINLQNYLNKGKEELKAAEKDKDKISEFIDSANKLKK